MPRERQPPASIASKRPFASPRGTFSSGYAKGHAIRGSRPSRWSLDEAIPWGGILPAKEKSSRAEIHGVHRRPENKGLSVANGPRMRKNPGLPCQLDLQPQIQAIQLLLAPMGCGNATLATGPGRTVWAGCRTVATITYRRERIARRHRARLLQTA